MRENCFPRGDGTREGKRKSKKLFFHRKIVSREETGRAKGSEKVGENCRVRTRDSFALNIPNKTKGMLSRSQVILCFSTSLVSLWEIYTILLYRDCH